MLRPTAKRFIEGYQQRLPQLVEAAECAQQFVLEALDSSHLDLHVVSARPKSFDSTLEKVRRKGYGSPSRQLTDQIGVRVITYYQDAVDIASDALANRLDVDEKRSVDKRQALGTQQFGYRSVHLIARLPEKQAADPRFRQLGRQVFEIQIRSILEHAWAEIEHEICYKSGVKFPEQIIRRFGAIAGALEILENQFSNLRKEKTRLVDIYHERYADGEDGGERFDAARLLGYLRAKFPEGVPMLTPEGKPQFRPRVEALCNEALMDAGVNNADSFDILAADRRFRVAVRRFASSNGLPAEQVSHFALCVIAAGIAAPRLLQEYPELLADPTLKKIVPN